MKGQIFTLIFAIFTLMAQAQDIEVPQIQRAIVTKHTATWCTNCGRTAWDVFTQVVNNLGDNAIPLSAHRSRSSDLYSDAAAAFLENMDGVIYQPEFFVNEKKISGGSSDLYNNIESEVFAIEAQTPDVQTGLELYLNEDGSGPLRINTRTKFLRELSGQYFLSVWLIEKEVIAFQQSQGNSATHKQVIRKALTESPFGMELFNGNAGPDEDIYMDLEYELEDGETMEGKEVMVAIWRWQNDRYNYVNSNASDIFFTQNTTTSVNQLDNRVSAFKVAPTVVEGQSTITIDLNTTLDRAQLNLYSATGQWTNNVFDGRLSGGIQHFYISKADLPAPGLYFLTLQSSQGVLSRKVIVK